MRPTIAARTDGVGDETPVCQLGGDDLEVRPCVYTYAQGDSKFETGQTPAILTVRKLFHVDFGSLVRVSA